MLCIVSQLSALLDRYERAAVEIRLAMIEMDLLNRYATELGWQCEGNTARRKRALVGVIDAHIALVTRRDPSPRA
jgi:hypothetical protein